jgi:hypothetical protein
MSRTADAAEDERLYGWALTNGSRLVNPTPLGPTQLRVNGWVCVGNHVYRDTNLRAAGTGGRLVELDGREPVHLRPEEKLTGFDLVPPLAVQGVPAIPAPVPPPPRSKHGRGASSRH